MDGLLEKFNEYKTIINYKFVYELEDGTHLDFKLRQKDFPHLVGLHKLVDIPIIRHFNDKNNKTVSAKYIISQIKKQSILTENIVRNSAYFQKIQQRYERFTKDNLLSISYTDVIIDFDKTIFGSRMNANYILYENQNIQGYNHLCIAENEKKEQYAESFFYEPSDLYLKNQRKVKIKKLTIYNEKDEIYLEDILDL